MELGTQLTHMLMTEAVFASGMQKCTGNMAK